MPNKLQYLMSFIRNDLWRIDLQNEPYLKRLMLQALKISIAMINVITSGMITLRAMSLVYTTLLSIVPLIAVSFSVLKGFGVHNQIEPMLAGFLEPLGSKGEEITSNIVVFVSNMKVGVLGAMGMAMLLYTVVSLLQKIESAFNDVWKISKKRSLARRFSDYLSVLMVGPVLVFAALGVTATAMNSSVVHQMMAIEPFGTLLLFVSKLLPYLFVIAAFSFIYVFVPNTHVSIRSAIVGGVVSGILWETTGIAFATFVAGSTNYTAIYSGFAILIIFMIWLYISWLILLFGAHVTFYHQNPEQLRATNTQVNLSGCHREQLAVAILFLITDSHYSAGERWNLRRIVERFKLPEEIIADILNILVCGNMIVEVSNDEGHYLPAVDPALITIEKVLKLIRHQGESNYHLMIEPNQAKQVAMIQKIESMQFEQIQHTDFKTLSTVE